LNVIQNTLEITFGWLFGAKTNRNSYKLLSDIDKVNYLEKRRHLKVIRNNGCIKDVGKKGF